MRTALVIGLVTMLVMLPLSILLGVLAGFFRGWVDDLMQYLYTTLSSIPGVWRIAAGVLMMQVVIDTHPQWFETAAERADLRLLALCFILGVTSWTGSVSYTHLVGNNILKYQRLDVAQRQRLRHEWNRPVLWPLAAAALLLVAVLLPAAIGYRRRERGTAR